MEEWTELAGTVRRNLMLVAIGATSSETLHDKIECAHRKLIACAEVARRVQAGARSSEIVIDDPPPAGISPTLVLRPPAASSTASGRSMPGPAASSSSAARALASGTARSGRAGKATATTRSTTPPRRCGGCAPPPRSPGGATTPSPWPGRFLAGRRTGPRGSRWSRTSCAVPSPRPPGRCALCVGFVALLYWSATRSACF
ncbi:hypothetical protein ACP70R_030513 [Stipagrostis hirtigluma subsp. patula]